MGVILIHLIDWSEIQWPHVVDNLKNFLYPFVMLFIATAGSLMVIASRKYDMLTVVKRMMKRGLEIFVLYFIYNISKLYIYDFNKQPFYQDAFEGASFTLANILTLKIFTVPIPILLTIAVYIVISPAILVVLRVIKYPKTFLLVLVGILLVLNYATEIPENPASDLLYSDTYVLFPIGFWLVPFLLGMYFGMLDLDKHKIRQIMLWACLTGISYAWWIRSGHSTWQPGSAMYPLHPYYICFSFFVMFVLIAGFDQLEKYNHPAINRVLSTIQMFGDNTLELYILHWLVIDITSWILFPYLAWLWLIMPLFFVIYSFWNRQTINRYEQYLSAT